MLPKKEDNSQLQKSLQNCKTNPLTLRALCVTFLCILDGFVKSRKNPSPLMGEGWGEGEKGSNSSSYIPLPFIPSHKGRGNGTFYEFVILEQNFKALIIIVRKE
ncbi:MAG: hypothetical protein COW04_10195 [Deltaproteobacteria bacterium CG12_big_fil_rev_8_21_14_0_65_43_10]|nr:MAG: hypothetical protein AUK23_07770 [Deltaproteobacteria bacterium CG2_30_43_15]PIQ44962.1 MAG: hypothetical protein COW04_10195 [Deltaproteobacteria bacterium CG12_big_fil_rev_8_21_14_0_65_43_10]PIU84843.1 MAG: hypothetical protein COS67_11080 [Deltaproteobacteria bacterium CG06_land_8_20_14_3_00_44_19]PIZ19526.1 MAG: hypothetical protein COY50_09565 [Deltaproteobacteria bacterium CG_4_10_14_0_8_um_filter_43_12]HCX89869.1 hypothetical protein [Deltaproteobacteria bacterium]